MEENKYNQRETLEEMNRQLTEQEQSLNAAYARLGKTYVMKHQNNPEDWAKDEVIAIGEEEKHLAQIKEKICELKGIRLCLNCGQEVPLDGVFCSNCGNVLRARKSPETSDSSLICRQCGNVIQPGQKFCVRCGTRVEQLQENKAPQMRSQGTVMPEPKTMPEAPKEEEKAPILSQQVPLKNMCPKCNKVFPDDMKFCTSCGGKLIRG